MCCLFFFLWTELIDITGKGDPPSPSVTAKDLQKERQIDALIKDPKRFLQSQERRASRVDIEVRCNRCVNRHLSNSTVFSLFSLVNIRRLASLFSLYIHQNYSRFCDDVVLGRQDFARFSKSHKANWSQLLPVIGTIGALSYLCD